MDSFMPTINQVRGTVNDNIRAATDPVLETLEDIQIELDLIVEQYVTSYDTYRYGGVPGRCALPRG